MSLCSRCSLSGVYLYSKDTQVSVIKETKLPVGVNGLCTDVCVGASVSGYEATFCANCNKR